MDSHLGIRARRTGGKVRPGILLILAVTTAMGTATTAAPPGGAEGTAGPFSVADYDGGEVYWVVDGQKRPYHGMREAWVFNRAMAWLGPGDGLDGAILCYSAQTPMPLTGRRGVSRWYCGKGAELADVDGEATRLTLPAGQAGWDHASLPPIQFAIEQTPAAELEVAQADCPWQFLIVVKGRSGPPLYASPWQQGPGKLAVDLLELYRGKGYAKHFAELHFAIAVRKAAKDRPAAITFRLRLAGREAIIPTLPVVRTADRAKSEGVPICALVLDAAGKRLGRDQAAVTVAIAGRTIDLAARDDGLWKATARDLPAGDHEAALRAVLKSPPGREVHTSLAIHITDGRFFGYGEELRLLTLDGKPIGPITGSYRGAPMFRDIGTPAERLVHGQADWDEIGGGPHGGQYFNHGGPRYGFHAWESLTPRELDADYAYLARCGWTVLHLCQGWWCWERLDAGGRIAPHGAEQLAAVLAAARRHGLRLNLALSHYPLGRQSKPCAQYLEAGYRPEDYRDEGSRFYAMFRGYLGDLAALVADDTGISSFTAAGEGDVDCGKTFVNAVCDFMRDRDRNHLFLCEPHLNPKPYPRDMNYYRREGWRPLLGGMRTYMIDRSPPDHVGVQMKLGLMGHIFLGEGVFWGFLNAPNDIVGYRRRVRHEFYTALACRSPIALSWEERVVEDERIIFEQVRKLASWEKKFRRPGLALRLGKDLDSLVKYEAALSRLPLEYAFLAPDEPAPDGTLYVIDTQAAFAAPAFASDGGKLPDDLKQEMPLRLPAARLSSPKPGWAATYSWTEDRQQLLAYLRNADGDAGNDKAAKDSPQTLTLQNFPKMPLAVRLFDLETKRPIHEGRLDGRAVIPISAAATDLFVLVGGR